MDAVRVQEAASLRLDDIYKFTRDRWDSEQADRYITGLFQAFDKIETHGVQSRPSRRSLASPASFFATNGISFTGAGLAMATSAS